MTTAELKMSKIIKTMTTRQICEAYEATNTNNDPSVPTVRGALMSELEARDASAFDAWIMTDNVVEMDKPSMFFCK